MNHETRFLPLLIVHISGGILSIAAGAVAMTFRKGSRGHGLAGNVFAVSMLTMTGCGAFLAFMKSQPSNFLVGTLTFYLVATAWLAARRREPKTGIFDWVGFLVALAVTTAFITCGVGALQGRPGLIVGAPVYFIFGSVALLAAAGDARMLARGGVQGMPRVFRHLWRMGVPLFIAVFSLFLGQPRLFPEWLRRSNLLFIPCLFALGSVLYWVFRMRFAEGYKPKPVPRRIDVHAAGLGSFFRGMTPKAKKEIGNFDTVG
jgi:hypothetical protein